MILAVAGVFSRLFGRHAPEEPPMMRQQPTDRRRDHEKRRAYAQKAELEAEVEALIRVRRKRERLADTHDSD